MFSFSFSLLFMQLLVSPLTNYLKQQLYTFSTLFRVRNNNGSIDLYNRDLQTTIILFTRNVFSHKTDWILSESPLIALSCLLYRSESSLMNALEGECFCLREIPINVPKLLAVLLLPVYLFVRFFILHFVGAYLLFNPLFLMMLLLYFYLFLDHVNKPTIIVIGAFVFYFKNTISIFVTISWNIYRVR